MSLFLGPIHYWLYNKIQWFEGIEKDIYNWAKNQNLPVEEMKERIYADFGELTGNKPLEEVIDTSNIHGWLQSKIRSAELRQAALVTGILKKDISYKENLAEIFRKQGEEAARNYDKEVFTPEEAYHAMNDFILEGMPCDRVNQVVSIDENEFIWETTVCLHRKYWEEVQGDVRNFYDLRENWMKSFVKILNPLLKYEKLSDRMHRIVKAA